MFRCHLGLFVSSGLVGLGCGHASPPVPVAAAAPQVIVSQAPVAGATLPADAIRRSSVRSVLAAGPGAFLQKVTLDDSPVFSAGKFHGFRIAALQGDSFRDVDLRPGDVVTRVEGMPIEHPEEAVEAFYTLQVASELRVDYERDGVAKTLRYRIVDDDGPNVAPAAPATPKPRR
jgi:type II secretory pathway component PulC